MVWEAQDGVPIDVMGQPTIKQCQERIQYILQQIESLEHYLPETYQMLMNELDQQNLLLKQAQLNTFYQQQNDDLKNQADDSTDQDQTQEHPDQWARVCQWWCRDWTRHHCPASRPQEEGTAMNPYFHYSSEEFSLDGPLPNPLSAWTYEQAMDFADELDLPDDDWEFIHCCYSIYERGLG